MKNQIYNIENTWYKEDYNNNIFSPKEAFLHGNSFPNEYQKYKNYEYGQIEISNKKEELLLNILKYDFILNDISLLLDINPNNQDLINKYNEYLNNKKELMNKYQNEYCLLEKEEFLNNNWNWVNNPWPWEVNK